MAAPDHWQRTGHGELRVGESLLRGSAVHDRETETRRIQVRLRRGPLRPLLRMRLDIDRWSASCTAVELILCRRVRPTAAYFRADQLVEVHCFYTENYLVTVHRAACPELAGLAAVIR